MISPQAWAAPEGLLSGLTDLSRALIMAPAQARAVQNRDEMMQLRQAMAEGKLATMGQDLELKRGFLGVQQEQARLAAEKQAGAKDLMLTKIKAQGMMKMATMLKQGVDPATMMPVQALLSSGDQDQMLQALDVLDALGTKGPPRGAAPAPSQELPAWLRGTINALTRQAQVPTDTRPELKLSPAPGFTVDPKETAAPPTESNAANWTRNFRGK
jgi:roadblock/LC7 domain-containing protein